MQEPMKLYQNDDYPAFPVPAIDTIIAAFSRFSVNGLGIAAVLLINATGLYSWSGKHYRQTLQAAKQSLRQAYRKN